jgi:hypothetical protein
MANPVLAGPIVRKFTPKVYVKFNWAGSWQYVPRLYPIRSRFSVSPQVSDADFVWHFGRVHALGLPPVSLTPLNLRDYYVKITAVQPLPDGQGTTEETLWVGIICDDEITLRRTSDLRGIQQIKAFGLEHLLDRIPIDRAYAEHNFNPMTLGWAPNFNDRAIGGRREVDVSTKQVTGNRRPGSLLFGQGVVLGGSSLWNLRQSIDYLLQYFTAGAIGFQLEGQHQTLEYYSQEIFKAEGKTIKAYLDEYVSRKRGLGWYIRTDGAGTVGIRVFTQVGTPVTVGSVTLPANDRLVPFVVNTTYPGPHLHDLGVFRYALSEEVKELLVQGQRIKVTANFSYPDHTLEEAWSNAQRLEYENGANSQDGEENDHFRSEDRFRRVFACHRVPRNWDGQVGNGKGGPKTNCLPITDDTGGVSVLGQPHHWTFGKSFERELPFMEGHDYDIAPPTNNLPTGAEPEFKPLAAILKDVDDRFVFVDRMNEKDADRLNNCHVRPLDREFAVELTVSPRHLIAHDFNTAWVGQPTRQEPEIDYKTLIIVGTFTGDQRQHYKVQNPNIQADVARRLTITVEESEFWLAHRETIWRIDTDGQPVSISAFNQILRNDRVKLEAVTAFAQGYFFTTRQAIRFVSQGLSRTQSITAELGSYINSLVGAAASEPVNAVVTAHIHNYRRQTTTTETGFLGVDDVVSAGLTLSKEFGSV